MELISSKFNDADNCWEVAVTGEIDIYNSGELKDGLLALIKEKEADITLDCALLRYLDSTALGALVTVLKNVKNYDGEMSLINVTRTVAKLFRITNLDKAFTITAESEKTAEKGAGDKDE